MDQSIQILKVITKLLDGEQTEGKIDGFVCASGTGGTIGGVSSYLKEKNKNILFV